MGKTINFNDAEKKARLRDIENEKILTDEEMKKAHELQAKANSRGMKLVPERKVKNRAKFVQIIQQNILYLKEQRYLTNAEKSFLIDVSGYVGFSSNCLVDDVNSKNPMPITQTDLAKKLGMDKSNMSKRINSLIDKGLLARSESALESNNARTYALFVNPNIMFSGNRDSVNETLKAIFVKAMKNPTLKNLPIRLI
ncbi:putative transcriptional regulator [Scopulibacillus daqui]|uniref:Transcriptional regulator n=1 Tax=Scopulibacillus daqui TaxID=1469162 RepID=A0ABS2Q410_9BACL|nr:helix-turn-helix domain-containing protein [Scopulibacillus daqui]MBM7647028.1 putative transcriptional regulator [Scopulibacillus daqui]